MAAIFISSTDQEKLPLHTDLTGLERRWGWGGTQPHLHVVDIGSDFGSGVVGKDPLTLELLAAISDHERSNGADTAVNARPIPGLL